MVGIFTSGKEEDPFASALSEFLESLTPSERSLFAATTTASHLLSDAILANENHEAKSSSRKLSKRLQPLFDGIAQYQSALDVFAGTSSVMGPIWGSLRIVLKVAMDFGEYFDKLAAMLEQIGYNLSRLRRYPRLYPDNEQLMKALVEVYKNVIKFCAKARGVFMEGKKKKNRLFDSVGLRTAMKALWKPLKAQFGDTQDAMAFYIDIIELEVAAAEKEEAHKERLRSEEERTMQQVFRKQSTKHQEEVATFLDDQDLRRMATWLSPANVEANHRAATAAKQEGTGSWFLNSEKFKKWQDDGDRGLLWLHAIPGAGKTVLASTIINYLTGIHRNSDVAVVYFYCDYKEPQQQCPTKILSTLLAMMASRNKTAFQAVQTFFQKQFRENPTYQVSFDELRNVLPNIAVMFRQVIVVIDALDESYSDRECLLKTVLEFSDSDSGCFKTLVTSRNVYDIAEAFRGFPTVCIGKEDNAGDIETYITAQIKGKIKDRKLKLRDSNLEHEIISTLQQKAEGMFQWVKCQIQYLCSMRSDRAIRGALQKLPKDLDDTYLRILEHMRSLPEECIANVQKVLQWLVRGKKTLTLPQIAEAIAIDLDDDDACERMDFDAVMTDPEDVLEHCGSLVTVSAHLEVSLAHYSVQEFLVSDRVKDTMGDFYMGGPVVSAQLAAVCLTYLCFEDFEDGPGSDEEFEETLDRYKFLKYAAQTWAVHATECTPEEGSKKVEDLALKLLTLGNGNFEYWRKAYHYRGRQRRKNAVLEEEPLYYASSFGLTWAVRALVGENQCSALRGGELPAAASEGHTEIVKILLERCSRAGGDEKLGRALYLAASKGHDQVVSLLLEKGANLEFSGKHGTPLLVAALEGRLKVVELLLDKGANLKAKNERFGTPLSAAAEKGHEKVVLELLRRGADPNYRGGWYFYSLQSAIVAESEKIVKLLLDNGAEVNAKGGRHQHSLIAAADAGNLKLVKLLIERGAEVNDYNDKGADALHAASCGGFIDIAELLIENDADVNAKGGKCRNALNAASTYGHAVVVEKLLAAGADLHFHDPNYGDALQAAARNGHNDVIRVLSKAGAKLNSHGSSVRGPAIECAAQAGHADTVDLLFELGLRKGPRRGNNQALVSAVYQGHRDVIKALVGYGANINAAVKTSSHKDMCTPLQVAASEGDKETLNLLLRLGADINVIAGKNGSALCSAVISEEGSNIVDILLEEGANVNSAGCIDYGTPLTAAVCLERKTIVTKLLKAGANPNQLVDGKINAMESAVAIAGGDGDPEILEMLIEYGGDINIFHECSQDIDKDSTPLQKACAFGDVDLVKRLILKHGAKICIGPECRRAGKLRKHQVSALVRACSKGHLEVAQTLIDLGADVNVRGGFSGTPLQATIAGYEGDDIFKVLDFLIDRGADVNAQTGSDGSPLVAAVFRGRKDIVRYLLKKGADINAVGRGWYAFPLQEAAKKGDRAMVKLLLRRGADPNLTGGHLHTALIAACTEVPDEEDEDNGTEDEPADTSDTGEEGGAGDTEGETNNSDAQNTDDGDETDWDASSVEGADDDDRDVYKILLDAGADVNATGGHYGTALQAAHTWGGYVVLSNLLGRGASRNLVGGKYGTALGGALSGACSGILSVYWTSYALQEDADLGFVNIPGGCNGPPLHQALMDWENRAPFARSLVGSMGADINLNDKEWGTPLTVACAYLEADPNADVLEQEELSSSLQFIYELVDKGADFHAEGGKYGTALQACVNGPLELATYLLEKGCDVNSTGGFCGSPLVRATYHGRREMVQLFLERGANPNLPSDKCGSALMTACYRGQLEIAESLVKHGADVNMRHKRHGCALVAALLMPHADRSSSGRAIIDLLLENGADVDAHGGPFGCPLTAALLGGYNDVVVTKFIERGANVNHKGGRYGFPLQAAAICSSVKVVTMLLDAGAVVNAIGGRYGTALVAAVANGRGAVAQLLVDRGAEKMDSGLWWRNMRIHKRKRRTELANNFLL